MSRLGNCVKVRINEKLWSAHESERFVAPGGGQKFPCFRTAAFTRARAHASVANEAKPLALGVQYL